MRAICTLAGKDFKNLVTSPLFFIISGLCTVLWSYSYMRSILEFAGKSRMYTQPGQDPALNVQREVFVGHISLLNLLLIFVVPALTMRMIAEEKRMRTFDLLLTAPINATQIALGKFFAGLATVTVLIGISLLYPLLTRFIAEFPMMPLLTAYLGMFLVAAAYVAIGTFASSLTDSVILSVVMGLIFNVLLWFISSGVGNDAHPLVQQILEYLSVGQHFMGFIVGSIKLKSLVFLLSVTSLFVFLTQRVIESSRWR